MGSLRERVIFVPATLDSKSVDSLASEIESAMQDAAVSAIVLQGSSDTFCRGLDLDEIAAPGADPNLAPRRAAADYCRCLRALRFSDKPTIALVEGATNGGGVGLVAACDVVIATDTATFGLPEVLFGFAPAMVLPFLLERVPAHTARIWALTGSARPATEAKAVGLVDVLVQSDELLPELRRWLKSLRRGLRSGVKIVKQLSAIMPALDKSAALELGQQSTLAALCDPGTVAAIRNFSNDGVLPWEAL
jgi:enoyl-CoA hydratase/carnithine racemase